MFQITITKILLPILILFILINLVLLNTFIHELGHIVSAGEQNISLKLKEIHIFGGGSVTPSSEYDCEKFNSLPIENKKRILHSGVIAELNFIFPLLTLSLILLLYLFIKYKRKNSIFFLLLIILSVFLLLMVVDTLDGNVLSMKFDADWNLINLSDCSIYS